MNPSDLIERAEALAGCRWDDESNRNGLYALYSAVAREMGHHQNQPRDDVATGMVLFYRLTPEGQQQAEANRSLALLLAMGLAPEDVSALVGRGRKDYD